MNMDNIRGRLSKLEAEAAQSGAPVRTDEVAVKTMTVEICVVKIGKRQMTLSTFWQIPLESILDPVTLEFKGEPWGIIRRDGVWVLWQKGNELRRLLLRSSDGMSRHGVVDYKKIDGYGIMRKGEDGLTREYAGPRMKEVDARVREATGRLNALNQLFIAT